jgi:hypothetical protein
MGSDEQVGQRTSFKINSPVFRTGAHQCLVVAIGYHDVVTAESGEHTRLACWVRRLAETNFLSADCDLDCNFIGTS